MGVFYIFKTVQMVANHAKHLIYFKHELSFREEMIDE